MNRKKKKKKIYKHIQHFYQMELNSKDKIIFFAKTDLSKPLSDHSKYIENLAETDPENPGTRLIYAYYQ